ncbi:hypothetical protein EGW08_015437 [Elysia chlorotica]|uniref:acylglycerol lipase n=1 Tax=Elysia chlorotica TaxID=188477 RepID=A0A433T5H7_ELYCH|nr:hypothetical protein EGW08_015437 [Elysia chlorotica]
MAPGSLRRFQRVGPSIHGNNTNSFMVELRSSRQLHILHLNPRPRDARFQQEMALYLQYRKSGPGVAGGPLSMPRRQLHPKQQINQQCSSNIPTHATELHHPLSATPEAKPDIEATPVNSKKVPETEVSNWASEVESTIYEGPSNESSLLPSPVHANPSANKRSASSVLLALHNQDRFTPSKTQLPQVPDGNDAALKLTLSQESKGFTREETLENKLSPLSPETQKNDASKCPDLFTPRLDQRGIDDDVTSPKSMPPSNNNLSSDPATAPDTDLVIFFIHGVGGSSDIWRGQTEYFAQLGYEVIAPDLIGHGISCTPQSKEAYHFREIAADMEEIFDTYCKRRNVLVGHSYGASFATLLARTRTRRVSRLVLVSGGPPSPLAPQPGVFTLPYCLLACIMPCLTRGFYKGAFNKKHNQNCLSAPRELAFQVPTRVLQHIMNGQDWSDGDELYHNWLTCPTLLLYGDKDRLVTLHEEQEMLRAVFDSRLEVIQEASHMVMMEAASQVNSLIHAFLLHPSQPPNGVHDIDDGKNNTNNASRDNLQSPSRSKSRRSLRSAKTPRSRPQRLLSKSVII